LIFDVSTGVYCSKNASLNSDKGIFTKILKVILILEGIFSVLSFAFCVVSLGVLVVPIDINYYNKNKNPFILLIKNYGCKSKWPFSKK
jgi:hypothetical protein